MRDKPMYFEAVTRHGEGRREDVRSGEPSGGGGVRSAGDTPAGPGSALSWRVTPIGIVRTPFITYREPPRHFKRVGRGTVEVFPEFEQGLQDLGGFSHLWLLTVLHRSQGHDLLLKPRRSDVLRGLFATRSPRRPNPVGLSLVRLVKIDGRFLQVTGADLLDGTPLLDIKPYVSDYDVAEAPACGWLDLEKGSRKKEDTRAVTSHKGSREARSEE